MLEGYTHTVLWFALLFQMIISLAAFQYISEKKER